jgi:hypothetical protein
MVAVSLVQERTHEVAFSVVRVRVRGSPTTNSESETSRVADGLGGVRTSTSTSARAGVVPFLPEQVAVNRVVPIDVGRTTHVPMVAVSLVQERTHEMTFSVTRVRVRLSSSITSVGPCSCAVGAGGGGGGDGSVEPFSLPEHAATSATSARATIPNWVRMAPRLLEGDKVLRSRAIWFHTIYLLHNISMVSTISDERLPFLLS